MLKDEFKYILRGSFRRKLEAANHLYGSDKFSLVADQIVKITKFEYGAMPASYPRIMGQFASYELFVLDLKTYRDVPFSLFCRKDRCEDIVSAIKEYINDPYPIPGDFHLMQHLERTYKYDEYDIYEAETNLRRARRTNFWWCIDHVSSPDIAFIGDWMLFIGEADRQEAFLRVINSDFSGWWANMPDDEREQLTKEAWKEPLTLRWKRT